MTKRIKKKYKPIILLARKVSELMSQVKLVFAGQKNVARRVETLEKIQSTNTQTINRKFDDYDKRIERLEREIKRPKKPFWKR